MFEYILGPDGKNVWCDDYNAPVELKGKWIPIEEWNKTFENKIRCPLCYELCELEEVDDDDDDYFDCDNCHSFFYVNCRDPLELMHDNGKKFLFELPIKFSTKNLTKNRELRFEVRGDEFDGPTHEDIIDVLNMALERINSEILEATQELINECGYLYDFGVMIDESKGDRPIYTLLEDGTYYSEEE